MHQSIAGPLDALMPRLRQAVLAELLLNPGREHYRSDLAKRLRVPASSLQRELVRFVAAGILKERREGNRAYYAADEGCPFLAELRGLLAKTAGVVDVLREALSGVRDKVRFAFVFGSMARGEERSGSDVDVLLVGRIGRRELVRPLRQAEERLGRAVNATTYTAGEFAERLAAGHHFLREVVGGKKLFVIGSEDDLEEARQRGSRAGARRDEERD